MTGVTDVLLGSAILVMLGIAAMAVVAERRAEAYRRRSWRTLRDIRERVIEESLLLATPVQLANALNERCGLTFVLLAVRPVAPGISNLEVSVRGLCPHAAARWCRLGAMLCVKPVPTEEN